MTTKEPFGDCVNRKTHRYRLSDKEEEILAVPLQIILRTFVGPPFLLVCFRGPNEIYQYKIPPP